MPQKGGVLARLAELEHEIRVLKRRTSIEGGGVPAAPHAATHSVGGEDAVDVTDLDGFPGGSPLTYLDSDGNFSDPDTSGPHAATHYDGAGDEIDITQLGGFPGGGSPLTYLDSDGNFTTPETGGGGGSGTLVVAVKTADETVNNSSTFQSDDHLTFPVDANAIYDITAKLLLGSTSVTPNYKFQWSLPAGANIYWAPAYDTGQGSDAGANWVQLNISGGSKAALLTNGLMNHNSGANSPHGLMLMGVLVVGATAGNCTLQWAQTTATVEDIKVLKGSNLVAVQLN